MRRSQQGAGKRDKPPQIHVTLSLGDDVQLHQSEQAWKPDRFGGSRVPDEERETRVSIKLCTLPVKKLYPVDILLFCKLFTLLLITMYIYKNAGTE